MLGEKIPILPFQRIKGNNYTPCVDFHDFKEFRLLLLRRRRIKLIEHVEVMQNILIVRTGL